MKLLIAKIKNKDSAYRQSQAGSMVPAICCRRRGILGLRAIHGAMGVMWLSVRQRQKSSLILSRFPR
jgi:hypothetical protein